MRVDVQGQGGYPQAGNADVDWNSLGRAIWRKKWRIILPALVVAVLTAIGVNFLTPRYKSEARILIESRENAFLRPEAEKSGERGQIDLETVASQVQILTSRDLARQVIRELKLAEKPEFDPVLRGVSLSSVLFSIIGVSKDPLRSTPEDRALTAYFERLNVVAIEKSRVLTIEFQSSDPELAARVANTIADVYLNLQQSAKREQTRGASQWLAGEIDKLRDKVAEAEGKVEDFRAKANLFVGNGNASLGNQQLTDLTTQLSTARAQKAELDAKSRLIRDMLNSGKPVESADIVNSELLRRLVEQRITLRAQLAEQSSTLMALHPRIRELNAQIGALDGQIRGELEKLVRSFENDARIAGARVETTIATIDRLKRQVAATGGQDVQLRALEREAKSQRDLLESYLAKYREASARDSIDATPADSRIISRASAANEVSFPKKTPIVLIATLSTLFIAATLVIAGELLGGGMPPAPREHPARTSASVAMFDVFRRKKPEPAAGLAASAQQSVAIMPIGELARMLRRVGEAGRRITIVGAARNVGTTYTAIGLARALVQQGARVVLVDLAIGAPNLSVLSANPDAPGIAELVRGDVSFGDVITRDRFSRVHLVTAGRLGGEGASILASPRLAMTLEALVRAYDHVVIDAGAVPEVPVESFARLAPRAVLVATDLSHPATLAARDRLMAAGFIDVTVFLGAPRGPDAVAASHPAAA